MNDTLYNHALDKNYGALIERAKNHPQEAEFVTSSGVTTLHWVVYDGAPFDVVRAVYMAYPSALDSINHHGNTPLDVALQCSSEDVVSFLRDPPFDAKTAFLELKKEMIQLRHENKKLSENFKRLERICADQEKDIYSLEEKLAFGPSTPDRSRNNKNGISALDDRTINIMTATEQKHISELKSGLNERYISKHPSIEYPQNFILR